MSASIAAALIVEDGRVLLVRRRMPEDGLLWSFPAGKVEPGETAEQAAVRETREEVGLEVEAVKSLGERIHPVTGRHMVYIACEVVSGLAYVAAPEELAEVKWIGLAEVDELLPGVFEPVRRYVEEQLGDET